GRVTGGCATGRAAATGGRTGGGGATTGTRSRLRASLTFASNAIVSDLGTKPGAVAGVWWVAPSSRYFAWNGLPATFAPSIVTLAFAGLTRMSISIRLGLAGAGGGGGAGCWASAFCTGGGGGWAAGWFAAAVGFASRSGRTTTTI